MSKSERRSSRLYLQYNQVFTLGAPGESLPLCSGSLHPSPTIFQVKNINPSPAYLTSLSGDTFLHLSINACLNPSHLKHKKNDQQHKNQIELINPSLDLAGLCSFCLHHNSSVPVNQSRTPTKTPLIFLLVVLQDQHVGKFSFKCCLGVR